MAANNALITIEDIDQHQLFKSNQLTIAIINRVRELAEKHEPDITTATGRKDIASNAYAVASSKTFLDAIGKEQVAKIKKEAAAIDKNRKTIRDELDKIRDNVRKPLTDWEADEQARIDAEVAAAEYARDWEEAIEHNTLIDRERKVAALEAEIARQKAESEANAIAEQAEKDRIEREKRIAQEAAQKAEREAEQKIAEAQAAEERQRKEKEEAIARAKAEQEAAVLKAQEDARREAERVEAARIAKEKAEKAEAERKAANKKHQAKINNEAVASLVALGHDEDFSKKLVISIALGQVKNVTINY